LNTIRKEEKSAAKYTVKLASSRVEKQLDGLPNKEYNLIRRKIFELANNPRPHGVKKLSDKVHRIRSGDYRIDIVKLEGFVLK
jgi:mRNA-degrading endonuclease RelE of RelBE toxin-antitoxin system